MNKLVKFGAAYDMSKCPMDGVSIRCVKVTPSKADTWLGRNEHNRHLYRPYAERLANEIVEGRWCFTHEGIAFDPDGNLIDGQHRLVAIVESETPLWMLVFRNITKDAFAAVNVGRSRNHVDVVNLGGEPDVKLAHLATLRCLMNGIHWDSSYSHGETFELFKKHRKAIMFANEHLDSAALGVLSGGVRGVVARAYYSQDQDKLIKFCEGLTEKAPLSKSGGFYTVASLKKKLQDIPSAGRHGRQQKYTLTAFALVNFLKGKIVKEVVPIDYEPFPIPGEKALPKGLE